MFIPQKMTVTVKKIICLCIRTCAWYLNYSSPHINLFRRVCPAISGLESTNTVGLSSLSLWLSLFGVEKDSPDYRFQVTLLSTLFSCTTDHQHPLSFFVSYSSSAAAYFAHSYPPLTTHHDDTSTLIIITRLFKQTSNYRPRRPI